MQRNHPAANLFRPENITPLESVMVILTASLALLTLMEHHPGLFFAIAIVAVLVLAMFERLRDIKQHAGKAGHSTIVSDGGTFSKAPEVPSYPTGNAIVHDGGNQRRLDH